MDGSADSVKTDKFSDQNYDICKQTTMGLGKSKSDKVLTETLLSIITG